MNELVAADNGESQNQHCASELQSAEAHSIAFMHGAYYNCNRNGTTYTLVDHYINVCHTVDNKPILRNEIRNVNVQSVNVYLCVLV